MGNRDISVKHAREHNLKNISVDIPRYSLSVITGVSGSGKSTLAFDIIYAEGHRRYVETLSTYARQFMEQLKKPEVENIDGLSPSISIDQKSTIHNPRSTVGTTTEIYDFLRLLYAKIGKVHCNICGEPIKASTSEDIANYCLSLPQGKKLWIIAPLVRGRKGEHSALLDKLKQEGFTSVKIDGKEHNLEEDIRLAKTKNHDIELYVDKLIVKPEIKLRLLEAIKTSQRLTGDLVKIESEGIDPITFSNKASCPKCNISYAEIEPRTFSFNSPYGACPKCTGLGKIAKSEESYVICPECQGRRLKKEALSILINGKSIYDISTECISDLIKTLSTLKLEGKEKIIGEKITKEILDRLQFIDNVGLGYLTLHRDAGSLSGGEAQRIRLATQLGASLTGVLYVLDEPSIGLHPRDNKKLIDSLNKLKSRGNTVLVVEHDEDMIRASDHIIDLGPGAGIHGGEVIAHGNLNAIISQSNSITGKYLASIMKIAVPKQRKKNNGKFLNMETVSTNNLKNVSVSFPMGLFTCITGVSGSGKSSLIIDTLFPIVENVITNKNDKYRHPNCAKITGLDLIDKVIDIDQSPIGKTPRSNPATYTGIFSLIRDLFASVPEARARGYSAGRFSFNVKGGRCETCEGGGQLKIEMNFMPNVFVTCQTCAGARYNLETLQIKFKGKNIAEILDLTVEEACEFFMNIPALKNKLQTLLDVGLGYIKVGQSATTLSGGEAQRVKLAKELSRSATGRTLYILDEPTTGLHFDDINKLLKVLHMLTDYGNTVIVIEHNLEVIKTADYIIDMGPEGGKAGGEIIATGTPEEIAKNPKSVTGKFLREKL